ncbi:CRAL-TRIO domain containing protein [Amanita muscaria]
MTIREHLRLNHETLLEQYHVNAENVSNLQATLLRDLLPSLEDELELDPETTDWTKEWLYDTCTYYPSRNNYTRSFALEDTRKNVVWRLNNFQHLVEFSSTDFLRCLPCNVLDPFDRPIIIVKLVAFNQTSDAIKLSILQAFEILRINLKRLNDKSAGNPALQYVVLLDLEGLFLQKLNMELVIWTLREVIPHYPGMLAGAFVLNYSWTHSGLWTFVKRLLPASALSRLFFPTQQELVEYFTPSALLKEYGGTLPFLAQSEDPCSFLNPLMRLTIAAPPQIQPETGVKTPKRDLSATSLLNPFFGYPASQASGVTILPHGRRRKRDLARTLALLFWTRWQRHITLAVVIAIVVLAVKIRGIHSYIGKFR